MKKLMALAIALLVIGITGTAVMAEDGLGSQSAVRAKIHTMGALGNGLAVSQGNPMDFEMIKIGIAEVDIVLSDGIDNIVKVGILYFGETKYKLKDVVIGNGTATANIYDLNDTQKGSISLSSYVKGDSEVWAGTMTLNGQTYNTYVIQAKRVLKPAEKADDTKEYCKNNPVKCMATMKAVGSILCDPAKEGETCREKIKTFCEQHPDDNRCKNLRLAYCKTHLEDANCRQELIERCKQNNTGVECDKLANMYNKYAEKKVEVMKNAPDWLKKVRSRIANRTQGEIDSEDGTTANNTGTNSSGGQ